MSDYVFRPEPFLRNVEAVYGKKLMEAIKTKLKRDKEEITEAMPVTGAEHDTLIGGVPNENELKRLLGGYRIYLKKPDGSVRGIGFDYYLEEMEGEGKT